ncbi:TssN family type VI secretion system protein [Xanthovirga aplysinae]|uniref:TssN family type VI secretion system protein n=1 Tax=Xanthovirga aplysinae TaxID=2529853 RepID=UPI0012BCFF7A|nr:TssN family type VI secretion system protein [Xanthovirga aplysinae]MTI31962.1 hypothetical protein [Xanthovirga aplysinae]
MKAHLKELFSTEIIVLCIILLTVSIVFTVIFSNMVKNYGQRYKKKVNIYIILAILVFGLDTFWGYSNLFVGIQETFAFFQLSFLVFGVIHVVIVHGLMDAFEDKDAVGKHLFFTLVISLYGMLAFCVVNTYLAGIDYLYIMLTAFMAFIIPTFFERTLNKALAIPARVMKNWTFPIQNGFSEPKDDELRDLVVLSFEFYKSSNDPLKTNFKAKAPIRMDFGRLFYHFVNDYNDRHQERIEVSNDKGEAGQWVFYIKPPWYGVAKYIDPDLPIYMNGIEENSVVICRRV